MPAVAVHYDITGVVQGVGFRYFVENAAKRHNINGWVRNTPSGGVEITAQGESDQMALFDKAVSRGPAGAYVREITRKSVEWNPVFKGFEIVF